MAPDRRFFSIIVPAHNERKYIADTLQHIQKLEYPQDRFEAIVIENGSTDGTIDVAQPFAGGNISVASVSTRGVSRARNTGVARMSPNADWVIFLDADTHLAPSFLQDLDSYLSRAAKKAYTVGTVALLPFPSSWYARAWYRWYNLGHKLTKTVMSMFILRADIARQTPFDETMHNGEDLKIINTARTKGKFFFFKTRAVSTSTRRFVKEGWWKIFFSWTFVAILPERIQRKMDYKVVR